MRFFFKFYLFIFGCIGSLLLCAGFLQLRRAGATLCCSAQASHCGGFSCCRARALGVRTSVVVAHGLSSCGSRALERRLSSCGTRAQLLCSMWNLPGPGLEPMSPALAGGFLTIVPPRKPQEIDFAHFISRILLWWLCFKSTLQLSCFNCNCNFNCPPSLFRSVFLPGILRADFRAKTSLLKPYFQHSEKHFGGKRIGFLIVL